MKKRLLGTLLCSALLLAAPVSQAAAQDATALWATNQGDLLIFLETTTNDLIGIRLLSNLQDVQIYLGQVSDGKFSLASLDLGTTLNGTINGNQMSGSFMEAGMAEVPFTAEVLLAYVGSAADGIWQTSLGNYLVVATTLFEGAPVTGVVDISLGVSAIEFDVFAGFFFFGAYSGASLLDQGMLTMSVTGDSASGFYGSAAQPLNFTANRLFKVKQPTN